MPAPAGARPLTFMTSPAARMLGAAGGHRAGPPPAPDGGGGRRPSGPQSPPVPPGRCRLPLPREVRPFGQRQSLGLGAKGTLK